MAVMKLMVMYPCPHDIEAFEKLYQDEDVPMGEGLSSEYAMTFEAFEKLYQEEHVPNLHARSNCCGTVVPRRCYRRTSWWVRGSPRLSCDSLAARNTG
jgi:hypothetical protein